jgi:hypothetical protein
MLVLSIKWIKFFFVIMTYFWQYTLFKRQNWPLIVFLSRLQYYVDCLKLMVCDISSLMWRAYLYGAWCHFQPYFSYMVVVSFIERGHQSTMRKPPTCRKWLQNTLPWEGLELTNVVVIGTDCIGSYLANLRLRTLRRRRTKILISSSFDVSHETLTVFII